MICLEILLSKQTYKQSLFLTNHVYSMVLTPKMQDLLLLIASHKESVKAQSLGYPKQHFTNRLFDLYQQSSDLNLRANISDFFSEAGPDWQEKLVARDHPKSSYREKALASLDDYILLLASNDPSVELLESNG